MRTLALAFALALVACRAPSAPSDGASPAPPSAPQTSAAPSPPALDAGPSAEVVSTAAGPITLHPVHHGTVWLEAGGVVVWVDPWSEGRLDGPRADLVLVTDIHPDHYDPAGLERVRKPTARVIAPAVVAEKVPGAVALKNGERRTEGALTVEAIPMYNLKRGPSEGKVFHEKGRGNGYVVTFGGKRVYFSGDTECTSEVRALADVELAFLCMNLPYTMPPTEAAECARAFRPRVLVPYHYRGQDLGQLDVLLAGSGVAVHKHALY